jgi:hypothetical protein
VIHVEMSEKDVDAPEMRGKIRGQASEPGAGVEHEHGAVLTANFDARRVATESRRLGSRRGERASRAP